MLEGRLIYLGGQIIYLNNGQVMSYNDDDPPKILYDSSSVIKIIDCNGSIIIIDIDHNVYWVSAKQKLHKLLAKGVTNIHVDNQRDLYLVRNQSGKEKYSVIEVDFDDDGAVDDNDIDEIPISLSTVPEYFDDGTASRNCSSQDECESSETLSSDNDIISVNHDVNGTLTLYYNRCSSSIPNVITWMTSESDSHNYRLEIIVLTITGEVYLAICEISGNSVLCSGEVDPKFPFQHITDLSNIVDFIYVSRHFVIYLDNIGQVYINTKLSQIVL